MACENKSKAIITWQWKDELETKYESKNCPVTVSLTPGSTDGYYTWFVKNSAGEIIYTVYGTEAYLYPNKSYGRVDSPGDYLVEFRQTPTSIFMVAVLWSFPVTLNLTNPSGCTIQIYDASGLVFSENKNKDCPIYNIRCEEECAEGEMKCLTNSYPGYYCVPCSQFRNEIASIKATLRSINNG